MYPYHAPVCGDGERVGVFAVSLFTELDHLFSGVIIQIQAGELHLQRAETHFNYLFN